FLEKRELDNMRDVEIGKTTKPSVNTNEVGLNGFKTEASVPAPPQKVLSHEERKQLARAVSNAEKRIQRLEEEITKIEQKMAEPTFYESPDMQKVMDSYQEKKTD